MTNPALPIVVVGAGPVGLTLALALLRQGLRVMVFERRDRLSVDSRASTIQPPTLEILDELGVLRAASQRARRVESLDYWAFDNGRRELLASLPMSLLSAHTAHPYRLHLAQDELCAVLFQAVEAEQTGVVHMGEKVVAISDQGSRIIVEVKVGARTRHVPAAWVCGADGLGSTVRRQLDLPVQRFGHSDAFVAAEAGLQLDRSIQAHSGLRLGDAAYVHVDSGWAFLMRMRDSFRILYTTLDASTDRGLAPSLSALAGDATIPLEHRSVYTVHQQITETWRCGRAVLLGDAAHSTYPVSGTSMNAGIQDAFTLAKMLPRSVESVDVWERSRRMEVQKRIHAYSSSAYKSLQANGLFSRLSRDRYLRRLRKDADAARAHLLRASMLERHSGRAPDLTE